MSSSFRDRSVPPRAPEKTGGSAGAAGTPSAPFPSWVDRVQNVRARHDAITRNLNTWSNYKNWAERVRTAWSEETPAAEDAAASFTDPPVPPNH
jgi:hypothetical protein